MYCFVSFGCQSIEEVPPPYTLQTYYSYFLLQVFFKDTLYFLLKYVLPPVLFTLTQVVLLLITPTFTRVRIRSNLGTTAWPQRPLIFDTHYINKITCICFSQVQRRYVIDQTWYGNPDSE